MPDIHNRDFSGGWQPSSDDSNSPASALPRADNLDLEEKGILSLRQGSDTQATFDGADVVSVYPVELDGTERILLEGGVSIYEVEAGVGAGLGVLIDSTDDVAFDSTDGHALIAAGTTKKKYDGTTVRNWGIAAPLGAPTVDGIPLSARTIANFSQGSAEFTAAEGTITYATGQDGVANAALNLVPAVGTGRAEITYNFSGATNLLDFTGAEGGDFDLFEFWFYDLQPTKFLRLTIAFGTDTGTDHFEENGYAYTFGSGLEPIGLTQQEIREAQENIVARGDEPEGPDVPLDPDDPRFPGNDRREDEAEARRERRRRGGGE